jgi:DNA-binding XRE family transcriptional regulator
MEVPDPVTFGDRLRRYRLERGWRQVDLADALGVHKDTVRNWEAGRVEPRLEILRVEGAGIIRGLCESRVGAARDSGNDALG